MRGLLKWPIYIGIAVLVVYLVMKFAPPGLTAVPMRYLGQLQAIIAEKMGRPPEEVTIELGEEVVPTPVPGAPPAEVRPTPAPAAPPFEMPAAVKDAQRLAGRGVQNLKTTPIAEIFNFRKVTFVGLGTMVVVLILFLGLLKFILPYGAKQVRGTAEGVQAATRGAPWLEWTLAGLGIGWLALQIRGGRVDTLLQSGTSLVPVIGLYIGTEALRGKLERLLGELGKFLSWLIYVIEFLAAIALTIFPLGAVGIQLVNQVLSIIPWGSRVTPVLNQLSTTTDLAGTMVPAAVLAALWLLKET